MRIDLVVVVVSSFTSVTKIYTLEVALVRVISLILSDLSQRLLLLLLFFHFFPLFCSIRHFDFRVKKIKSESEKIVTRSYLKNFTRKFFLLFLLYPSAVSNNREREPQHSFMRLYTCFLPFCIHSSKSEQQGK